MSRSATSKPTPTRIVTTRRIAISYPQDALPRHYVGGDLVMSHVVTNLSAMFPEGEDFFVRSVRNYRNRIDDPELKRQVAGFIGQEAMHGREHRTFNARLNEMGYPTRELDRVVKWVMQLGEKVLPQSVQLAITAALEHYTATLAEVILTDPEARTMIDVEEVRSLFLWHALEESEHKSVAFDVYQHVCGNWRRRVIVMQAVTVGFLFAIVASTVRSLAVDRASYHPVRLARSLAALRRSPFLRRSVIRHLMSYNRRDFHPEDSDTNHVTERWRAELFGSHGSLTPLLRTAPMEPPALTGADVN
jgi:predicted metal-dependent hydrolase